MSKTRSVVIDAGHGGTDPGANGFGIREKDWALKISLYQYKRLKELGAKVGITRTTDKTLSSVPRTNLIKNKYDICVSNHWNAFNGAARGIETIHSINSNGHFAKELANVLVGTTGLPLRRVFTRKGSGGTDFYYMHRMTGNTATVIIEYGFIDNMADNAWYKDEGNFYKAAEAVIRVVCKEIGIKYVAPGAITPSSGKSIETLAHEVIAGKHGTGAERRKSLGSQYDAVQLKVNQILSVKETKPQLKSVNTIAKEVIAGKWGNGSERKNKLERAGYNPSTIQAEVNKLTSPTPKPKLKSVSTVAKEVIAGKWGNGSERQKRLSDAGYNASAVQAEVNRLASPTPKKSANQVAKEVVAGKWGNGSERRRKLSAAGYNPDEIQKLVNKIFG